MGLLNRPRTEASDAGQDLVGRLRPDEGLRGLVACFEVLTDRFFEFCCARVTAAPKSLLQSRETRIDEAFPPLTYNLWVRAKLAARSRKNAPCRSKDEHLRAYEASSSRILRPLIFIF
jgi:hypothetical protein